MKNSDGLCECGCGQQAPIAQKTYTSRGIKKGEPFRFIVNHHRRLPFRSVEEDRGFATPCHIWTGRLNASGYGIGPRNGANHQQLAHRIAWQTAHGPIPEGQCVLHRCDIPSCVNPDHLFLGTQADNVADMERKGRARQALGEAHHATKLTAAQVEAIRRVRDISVREIAGIAGASESTVAKIRRGKTRVAG